MAATGPDRSVWAESDREALGSLASSKPACGNHCLLLDHAATFLVALTTHSCCIQCIYQNDLMSIHGTELYMWSRLYKHLIATVHSVLQADNTILTISPHAQGLRLASWLHLCFDIGFDGGEACGV